VNPPPAGEPGQPARRLPSSSCEPAPLLSARSAAIIALALALGELAVMLAGYGTHLTAATGLGSAVVAAVIPVLNRIVG
jgi:hypothetical protein